MQGVAGNCQKFQRLTALRVDIAGTLEAFFQLYNQSAVLYRQTKQNYTLYNTFTDLINYLNKEIGLIESIYQGYPQ